MVANHDPWFDAAGQRPGAVRYGGAGIERFSTRKRIVASIGASSPVTQISPSPCWGWTATLPGLGLLADDFSEP